ncbi:hypothetical protein GWK47_047447 [Chionoecetes opilio]|uniref:Uncharacterized protein n=1 Tax=Chionoecetes opilio TaxID=41210 RepID=A0A8J4YB56_CHIOP|nr:hypothetical protein GWK47_047447 [Chionoecetes opilio]
MSSARDLTREESGYQNSWIGYDGRKDKTRAMMAHHSPVARVHVDQKAWTGLARAEHPGILVKYCLQVYFKIYYENQGSPQTRGRNPKHILTQLRVMRSQPKKVQQL